MRNEEPSGIVVLLIQDVLNKAILHNTMQIISRNYCKIIGYGLQVHSSNKQACK